MSGPARLERELEVARRAVLEASRLTSALQARLVAALATPGAQGVGAGGPGGLGMTKDDHSPVTVADFGAQALVCGRLGEAFPADPVLGEESSAALRADAGRALGAQVLAAVQAERPEADRERVLGWIDRGACREAAPRAWTLDPIDGTKGFLRGEQYAVALALIEGGQVVLAAIACPNLPAAPGGVGGTLVWAVRGEGAWQAPLEAPDRSRPIQASRELNAARLRVVMSVDPGHSDQERTLAVMQRLGIEAPPRRLDSLSKYALVGRGEAEVYYRIPRSRNRQENIWDHAAGVLIVEAAGGAVTDLDGRALDFGQGPTLSRNRGVLASHGPLHARLLEALAHTEPPGGRG